MHNYGPYPPPPSYARPYDPQRNQLQSPLLAGAGGAVVAGTGMAAWNVGQELATDAIWRKRDTPGTFTNTAKKTLFGNEVITDARKLIVRGDEKDLLKQTGNFTKASWNLAKKSGSVVNKFGKELWKTPTGKGMAAWTAGVALITGGMAAHNAGQHNQRIVNRQNRKIENLDYRTENLELSEQARTDEVFRNMNSSNSVDIKPMLAQIDREATDF